MDTETKQLNFSLHRFMAVIVDVVVVIAFVLIGGRSHHSDFRFSDVVIIGLPFIAAFFAVMLVVSKDLRDVKTAFIASVLAVPIAILLRINLPQIVGREPYSFKPVFAIISFIFLTTCWVGWRFMLNKLSPQTKG